MLEYVFLSAGMQFAALYTFLVGIQCVVCVIPPLLVYMLRYACFWFSVGMQYVLLYVFSVQCWHAICCNMCVFPSALEYSMLYYVCFTFCVGIQYIKLCVPSLCWCDTTCLIICALIFFV